MLFFDLTPVDPAVDQISAFLERTLFTSIESISLAQAYGRKLARDIIAPESVPNFEKSTVDGYAVKADDTVGATDTIPALLLLDGQIKMGEEVITPLTSGRARKIPTGGMLPPGADAAVMIEHTERLGDDIFVSRSVASGDNTIRVGEDISEGDIVLQKGTLLGAGQIGALATLSIENVDVYRRPRFCILSTGDEIRPLGTPLKIGEVRDSNAYVLSSQIKALGGTVVFTSLVGDDPAALHDYVERGIEETDIVLVSGGSSVGEKDFTKATMLSFPDSRLLFHGLKAKPGKPTLAATVSDTLLLGLPGHPASCQIIFQSLMFPVFRRLGLKTSGAAPLNAILMENCHGAPGRTTYQAVRLGKNDDGQVICTPLRGQSGLVSLLAKADGYFVIPENEEGVYAGSLVSVKMMEG